MGSVVKKATDAVGLTDSGAAEKLAGKATGVTKGMARRLKKLDTPDIEDQEIDLSLPELVGLLETEQISPSEFESIVEDKQLRTDQLSALESLRERSEKGMTEQDKFQQEELLGDIAAQEMSQRRAIEQQMARQGMESSGASLAAKLQAQQNAANQGREQAMRNAAQSQANRMAAAQNLAQQAGNMRSQDFNIASARASAADAINRANAMNRQEIAGKNLGLRQSIANRRGDIQNQQEMYNKGLIQQKYQNELSKATGQNQMDANLANMYNQQAAASAKADSAMLGTLGTIGGAVAGGMYGGPAGAAAGASIGGGLGSSLSDKNTKEDIEEGSSSIREFLDKLKPYKYNYKDEYVENGNMEGEQLGIMAQDLEKSEVGEEFVEEDSEDMKRVDYDKMAPTQLAALADLHKRMKKLEGDK